MRTWAQSAVDQTHRRINLRVGDLAQQAAVSGGTETG